MSKSPERLPSEIDQWHSDLEQAQKWAITEIPRSKLLDISVYELALLMREAIDDRRIDLDQNPIHAQKIEIKPSISPTLEEGTRSNEWRYFVGSSALAAIATGVSLAVDGDLGKSIATLSGLYCVTTAFVAGYKTRSQSNTQAL
jgi:hypothetical protein